MVPADSWGGRWIMPGGHSASLRTVNTTRPRGRTMIKDCPVGVEITLWSRNGNMADGNQTLTDVIGSELVQEDASFADIVAQFVDGLTQRLTTMEEAVQGGDFETLYVAAHQLKGAAGGYGYPIVTDRAAQLERHAQAEVLDDCVNALEHLKEICARVVVDAGD